MTIINPSLEIPFQNGMTKALKALEIGGPPWIMPSHMQRTSLSACAQQSGIRIRTKKKTDGTVLVWRIEPEKDES